MAARTRKTELDEGWRARIKTSMLLNRLNAHALGEVEMTASQIKAAEVCLRKTVPDLSATKFDGEMHHTFDLGVLSRR